MTKLSSITPWQYRSNPRGQDPDFKLADTYYYRGNAYERKGLYEEAIRRFYHGTISLKPRFWKVAYEHRGKQVFAQGALRPGHRGFYFSTANFAQFTQCRQPYYQSSSCISAIKGLDDRPPITDLIKEISLAPNDTGAYGLTRSSPMRTKGLYDQAIADYTQENCA